jgi:hypothetical protein
MSKNPYFVSRWHENHFDPYKIDRDKRAAQRALDAKMTTRVMGGLRPNPSTNMERVVRGDQARRAKIPVTLPKVWGDQ